MLLLPHVPRSGTAPSATQRGERTLERSTTGIRRTGGRGHRPSQPRMRSCGLALNATVQMAMIDVVSVAEGVRAGTWSPGRALPQMLRMSTEDRTVRNRLNPTSPATTTLPANWMGRCSSTADRRPGRAVRPMT